MNIQIDGIYFPNKGDELMFHAINAKMRESGNQLVYGKGKGPADSAIIRNSGVFQIAHLQRYKIRFDKIFNDNYLYRYGLIRENAITAILDSGGFQFGDQWEDRYNKKVVQNMQKYYRYYKKYGTKIIFMPQALGPFTKSNSKEVAKIIYEYSDYIFARDNQSFKFLAEQVGTSDKLDIAPDFTNLLSADKIPIQLPNHYVAIIPNSKMITHTDKDVSTSYKKFMIEMIDRLVGNDQNILFLNHEGEGDDLLIKELNRETGNKSYYYPKLTAREIKATIAKANILISSRFHGAVSGLSQGTPTFCTSWSHKYTELLKDYGMEDNLLDVQNPANSFSKIVNFKFDEKQQEIAISSQKNRSDKMWEKVFEIIG